MDVFRRYIPWFVAFVLSVSIVVGYRALFSAPSDFSSGTYVRIQEGSSVPDIANVLAQAHIIAHPTILRAILRVSGESDAVQAGVYKFEVPQNVFDIVYRLVIGDYGLPPVRLTFIEGVTTREMALQIASVFPDIEAKVFLSAAQPEEGYLFPDTYFFHSGATIESIMKTLRANFDRKISYLSKEIKISGRSLSDIVIMASLIEKEASNAADRRMIAGILWNRVDRGMPLQVDAVFGFIFDKGTYSPSPTDLKVNSPYNTYTHTGLPPGPIGNPGLDALTAAVSPTETNNIFYLTGNDGRMHYATTYTGHQANLKKYLQ